MIRSKLSTSQSFAHSTLSFRNAQGLADVITQSRAFMSSTAKAKTAKLSEQVLHSRLIFNSIIIVRTLLDYFNAVPGSQPVQIKVLTDNISWARTEKRIFLKHNLEIRLVALYVYSVLSCLFIIIQDLPFNSESWNHNNILLPYR